MTMLAGVCPVATMTVAVAASIPPSRKNCQGWRNGSSLGIRLWSVPSAPSATLVKISEFVVEARRHLGVFHAGGHSGQRWTARPAPGKVGDGHQAADADD